MEDDDEVVKAPSMDEQLTESKQSEEPSAAGDSPGLAPPVVVDGGALPEIVDEVIDSGNGDARGKEGLSVGDSKPEKNEQEMKDDIAKIEDEVIDSIEIDERGKESLSVGESKPEKNEQETKVDIAKIEDEVIDSIERDERGKEGLSVGESESEKHEQETKDDIAKIEDEVIDSIEGDEREMEGPSIGESEPERKEHETKDDIAKIEDSEGKTEEIDREEREKVEKLSPEEFEEKNESVKVDEEEKIGTEEIVKEEIKDLEVVEEEEEEEGDRDEEVEEMEDGNESVPVPSKDEGLVEEETPVGDAEMEMETVKSGSGSGGKRKRGRNSKAASTRAPVRKTVGEDVCFICLDGGDLVLCDRRGCPKAYHPSCVDHDEDFFKTKGRWNCGWHLCNNCGKNAHFMCLTCTFSLCKGCCKDSVVFCVRGNRGFCESCMKTIMLIENGEQNEVGRAAFDDKSSWEYLFKDYWMEQKRKLCITSDELAQAKNPSRSSDAINKQHDTEVHDVNNDAGTDSDSSQGHLEVADSKRKRAKRKSKPVNSDTDSSSEKDASTLTRKTKRRLRMQIKEVYSDSEHSSGNRDTNNKRGRKPRRLSKSRSMEGDSAGGSAVANEGISAEGSVEWASKELLEFVMHMKDGDTSVLSQFDVQALLLEYIKRNKLRDPRRQSQIICDSMLQKLFGKPRVGHFEMLKLLESHFLLKEDFQVDDNHGSVVDDTSPDADDNADFLLDAGRSKGRKSRKRGDERGLQSNLDDYAAIDMHNINLIYLRRNLIEALMDDTETFHDKVVGSFVRIRISGSSHKQDIYRLVQIIGTTKAAEPYKVGKRTTDVVLEILNLDKTENVAIDTISNQEFTEDECKRLRQSIKCGLLSRMTVGDVLEKARELQEVRVTDWLEAEIVRLSHLRDRASEKGRKKELRECVEKLQLLKSPEERQRRLEVIPEVHADPKMDPNCESEDENEMDNKRQASNMRTRDGGFYRRGREHFSSRKGGSSPNDSWSANARPPSKNWELNRNLSGKGFSSRREDTAVTPQTSEHAWNNGIDKGTPSSNSWEKPRPTSDPLSTRAEYSGVQSDMSPVTPSGSSPAGVAQTDAKVNEAEKMWHYRDPTGKVQGPFSMVQLRKWSNTGYFPADLKIWKTSQVEDDSVLLTDVLAGKFQNSNTPSSIDTSKFSGNVHGSDSVGRYGSSNLPSPTPGQLTAGLGGKQPSESRWSSASSSFRSNNQFQGGSERLPSPTPTSPSSAPSGLGRSNFAQQSSVGGNKVENVGVSLGRVQPTSNSSGQFSSTSGPRPDVSLNSGSLNTQQISSQSVAHAPNQSFAPPDAGTSQSNLGPNARTAALGFSNVAQAGTGQNPAVYSHGWQSGFVARPEVVTANLTHNHPNPVPPQLPHGQWTGAPVNNQASSYGAGYPPSMGNMASNMPAMPSHNAWGPPANMPWGNQQQQPLNPNMGWAMSPAAAFGPSGVGQLPGPMQGAPTMPTGNSTLGWTGSGPNPSGGTTNPGWVAPPGNTGTWGGDQNRSGSGGGSGSGSGSQWNRQSSFGSGAQKVCKFHENGHCRKGTSCDFMHT